MSLRQRKQSVLECTIRCVKELLFVTKLNKPFSGGMSGYVTVYLILFAHDIFLQRYGTEALTLGKLLLFIFHLFTVEWQPSWQISVDPLWEMKTKYSVSYNPINPINPMEYKDTTSPLWIDDPFLAQKSLANGCFRFIEIQQMFRFCLRRLTQEEDNFSSLLAYFSQPQ